MAFQILNKEGKAIYIAHKTEPCLDKEAAEFWQVEVHPKRYSGPKGAGFAGNWFDTIGYAIHSPGNYTRGWNNVKCTMLSVLTAGYGMLPLAEQIEELKKSNLFLAPYFALIDHWAAKGYTPQHIKD